MTEVTIIRDSRFSRLVLNGSREDKIVHVADDVTSWKVPGAEWSEAFVDHHWDGYKHLLSPKRLKFPGGLTKIVVEAFERNHIDFEVQDERVFQECGEEMIELEGIELREDQKAAALACMKEKCGIIWVPPGGGKTESMIALVVSLGVYPVLWLTHTRELIDQTYRRFRKRLRYRQISIGKIGEGVWRPRDVTVATVQSLSSRTRKERSRELLKQVQVVICDEVHREPAKTWYRLVMQCTAPYRFGCSATPLDRQDGSALSLIGSVGEVVYRMTVDEGAELGVFEIPELFFVDYMTGATSTRGRWMGLWQELYQQGIVHQETRNQAILELCHQSVLEGRKVLVLIRQIAHGRYLHERLRDWFDHDSLVQFIYGADPSIARKEAIRAFRRGRCKVLIASSILDEGVDIPEIDTVIIASAGKSPIKAVQRVGRGMRKGENKKLRVYDFVDRYHGILLKHSRARKKAYERFSQTKASVLVEKEKS